MSQGDNPLLLQARPQVKPERFRNDERPTRNKREGGGRGERPFRKDGPPEKGMERFRIEVGHDHGVKPGNIVGAIANEAGMDSEHIGRINIQNDFSLIDLPEGIPKDIFFFFKNVWVSGQKLKISRLERERKKHFSHSKNKSGKKIIKHSHKGKAENKHKPKERAHRKGKKPE